MLPGVSFIVRARNEGAYLGACLESLRGVTIPHEILVTLHLCTDESRAVAEAAAAAGQPVTIRTYDWPVSRAGYEMLTTPVDHPASMAAYSNACYNARAYNWAFRWDADFIASPELLHFLNTSLPLGEERATAYIIPCQLSDTVQNCEKYLTNVHTAHGKYMFWEVGLYPVDTRTERLECTIASIPPTVLKTYWQAAPWFLGVDAELSAKYAHLVSLCGPEPTGMARASNPECTPFIQAVAGKEQALAEAGISLYR